MSRRAAPSIRQLLAVLLAAVVVLAALLSVVTILQMRTATDRTEAERQRVTSFRLSDGMRQSSNDLTRMVRLYVVTGDPRYREYYDRILAIRNGTAPRPRNYDSSFWDRLLARPDDPIAVGPPASLTELMRRAHFSTDEFAALGGSLRASNELALLEVRVMDRVAPRIARGVDADYVRDVAPQHARLVDANYHRQKRTIMAAIDRFTALVDARTAQRAADLQSRTDRLLIAQTAILALLVGALIVVLAISARAIVRPLSRLADVTRRITRGDWSQRARPQGVRELAQLAGDFNEMTDAVRRALDDAEAADRAKSAFLAMMSHELRTPLVAVTGTLEILSLDDLDERQRELVDVAMGSARALLAVIGDVLDFSKIEAGYLEVHPVTVAVGPLVDQLAAQHRHAAAIRGLQLRTSVGSRLAAAHVIDAARLRQVLGNLVGNALKFTRDGGVDIEVVLAEQQVESQRLRFTVRDSGIGISDEDQQRLFKPFTQASTDNARSSEGTGLGLAICRQLVRAMGGEVMLASTPEEGTTVAFELTLAVGAATEIEPGEAERRARFAGRRALPSRAEALAEGTLLLLVEDNPVNRQVLGGQLEAIGFAVDTAPDAEQALQRFAQTGYGLVFTDIQLPHVDGYELARRLRAHERNNDRARTPMLALTASALQGELARCREAGMDDLVTKPTTMDVLAGALRRWLPHAEWPEPVGLDRTALDEVAAGDPQLSAQILGSYAESMREDVAVLSAAIDAGDRAQLRHRAHQIAGASRTVGAEVVAATAARLERLALECPDAELAELLRELFGALDQIASSLPASAALREAVAPEATTEPASSTT